MLEFWGKEFTKTNFGIISYYSLEFEKKMPAVTMQLNTNFLINCIYNLQLYSGV